MCWSSELGSKIYEEEEEAEAEAEEEVLRLERTAGVNGKL